MSIELLHKCYLESNNVCTDTRKLKPNDIYFALKGDNFNGNLFANNALKQGAKFVVIDEEIEKTKKNSCYIFVENVLSTLQELAKFHRNFLKIPIIGLTGSNGKTTTKELINAVLSQKYNTKATIGNLNNHIGVPITLLSMTTETEIGIVEMGANHQKEIEFLCEIAQPDFGYITNFGKAHLEGFGGIEGVIKGKSELYQFLKKEKKTVFINNNDLKQVELTKELNTFSFGINNESNCKITLVDYASEFLSIDYHQSIINTHLTGLYNFNNISAAICIGQFFKVDVTDIKKGIENYIPSNNRSEIIVKDGKKIILDAYNANPSSMEAALINLEKIKSDKKIAFLGDMFELGKDAKKEHQYISDFSSNLNFDHVYLIGENFYKTNNKNKNKTLFKTFNDLKLEFNNIDLKTSTILIKGSRGMALERILSLID